MRRISCFNFYKFKIVIYGALNKGYNIINITTAKKYYGINIIDVKKLLYNLNSF